MALNISKEVAAMMRTTARELQEKYAEVFGERPRSRNKQWLVKRIAWRLQANEEGDLSERARRRAMELSNDADLRVTAPREMNHEPSGDLGLLKYPSHSTISIGCTRRQSWVLPGTQSR